jgi:hypothetical protein
MNRSISCALTTAAAIGLGTLSGGCLDRPVVAVEPLTKTNFSNRVTQDAVDKLDILFDVDNSASMGDKQAYLEAAIPDLIKRLVNPNCIENIDGVTVAGPSIDDSCASYAVASTLEFHPVRDMHLGIVSSSLGNRGGDVCPPTQMTNDNGPFADGSPAIPSHTDDQGHLLSRSYPAAGTFPANAESEMTSPDVGGQGFLDWFPSATSTDPSPVEGTPSLSPTATALADSTALESDFQGLVTGVHEYGCGIESQLESWYRFLVQPDPYESITPGTATWVGYDQTIIQQRHDFLRPDSLVAIIVLSDENDSEIDVRSSGGLAYHFMDTEFEPPRGTSACATDPGSPACTWCAYTTAAGDPNCKLGPYTSPVDWGYDPNLRHVHMQQKYGMVPQYPLERYVLGLTSSTVPDRNHEYPGSQTYRGGIASDPAGSADLNCTNPLFAKSLPDGSQMDPTTLCNAAGAGGTRTPKLVFFAHIGGVPHQLLQVNPCYPTNTPGCSNTSPLKDKLTTTDWVAILGNDPDHYDYTGIDPHMIEDYQPRTDAGLAVSPPQALGGGPDPIDGREWFTDTMTAGDGGSVAAHTNLKVDREYACIFRLEKPDGAANPRDCSNTAYDGGVSADFVNQEACDCSSKGLPPQAVPAVCGQCTAETCSQGGTDYNAQYYAKAYPTIREIELVEKMGRQGVLSSLCPIDTIDNAAGTDALYGYRPAINSIVNRLKTALTTQCLPEQLAPSTDAGIACDGGAECDVPCLVLATLPATDTLGCSGPGLSPVPPQILANFRRQEDAASALTVCQVHQIPYAAGQTCAASATSGWCYVTGTPAGACSQEIVFSSTGPLPNGSVVSLECLEESVNVGDGG